MKPSYLSNKSLLDDLWSARYVSQEFRILGCSNQLGAADAVERIRGNTHNKRAQH